MSAHFVDYMLTTLNVKNDRKLCAILEMGTAHLSRIRQGKLPVPDSLIVRFHEESGVSIKEIKEIVKEGYELNYNLRMIN